MLPSLANTLKEHARFQRRLLILDCCFAAEAARYFQGSDLARVVELKVKDAFEVPEIGVGLPSRGTSLLCSSSRRFTSRLAPNEQYTMFSEAFLWALSEGDPSLEADLSLYTLERLTEDYLRRTYRDDDEAPRPEVHSPDQHEGDVARIPIFLNLGAKVAEQARKAEEERKRKVQEELAQRLIVEWMKKEEDRLRKEREDIALREQEENSCRVEEQRVRKEQEDEQERIRRAREEVPVTDGKRADTLPQGAEHTSATSTRQEPEKANEAAAPSSPESTTHSSSSLSRDDHSLEPHHRPIGRTRILLLALAFLLIVASGGGVYATIRSSNIRTQATATTMAQQTSQYVATTNAQVATTNAQHSTQFAATDTAANATATASVYVPYQAKAPDCTQDSGPGNWTSWAPDGSSQGIVCLSDRLRLIGVQVKYPNGDTSTYKRIRFVRTPFTPIYSVSVEISNIGAGSGASMELETTDDTYLFTLDLAQWELGRIVKATNGTSTIAYGSYDRTATNTLTIVIRGAYRSFLLNGTQVASYQEARSAATIAIYLEAGGGIEASGSTSPPAQADFQNFIYSPQP